MPTVVHSNYFWQVYSGPNFPEPSCMMVVYETFDDGTKSQRVAEGLEKVRLVEQMRQERAVAERFENYDQKTISEPDHIYKRMSLSTGNSWEVQLDEDGAPIPDPCIPTPDTDSRDLEVLLSSAKVTLKITPLQSGVRAFSLNVSGNLPTA